MRFEDLPRGSRRAIVRWSDGSEGEALSWYADEILVCEGDHGNSRLMALGLRCTVLLGRSAGGGTHNQHG
jgi:hypothetical protein